MYLEGACPIPWRLRLPLERVARKLQPLAKPLERVEVQSGQFLTDEPELSIIAAGDLAMSKMSSYSCNHVLGDLQPVWNNADLRLANFEAQCTTREQKAVAGSAMRSTPAGMQFVSETKLDAVTVANNHALDYGSDALTESRERLSAAGVAVSGYTVNGAEAAPAIIERRGLRVGMLAWCDQYRPPLDESITARPALMPATEMMEAAVRHLRSLVDIVIVQLHCGYEFSLHPMVRHRDLARQIASAGAHIVLCHHSHIPMAVEAHGHSIIAHGLGNWVFQGGRYLRDNHDWTRRSFLLRISASRSGARWAQLEPFDQLDGPRLRLMNGRSREQFLSAIAKISSRLEDTEWLRKAALARSIFEAVWLTEILRHADAKGVRERALILRMPANQALIHDLRNLGIAPAAELAEWFEALANAACEDKRLQEVWERGRLRSIALSKDLRFHQNWMDVFRSRIP